MTPRIRSLQYKKKFIYYIRFEDNRGGDIDFESIIWGDAFRELRDQVFFKRASIDSTTGTISWPNGVDIAPETLYKKVINVTKSLYHSSPR